ncbi:cytochrome P450 [Saccharopolyspora mangrovi]|uniref:Cytochrome P450 n=1 Tax=Saccharopolyspora mangrovi TaxID=3082379 RepID=A0ABU6AIP6_9PSEU|nr:cytochrome P450 [Saccharopolyspora sp. S2-29]MEB3371342.1 cytochrome P450 [Saccharopolyspora sp. S2-29]
MATSESSGLVIPRAGVDLGHPDTYADGVPYEVFARLRDEAPVAWVDEPPYKGFDGGPGFWAVTRHADINEVSRHPEVHSSHAGATFLRDQRPRDLAALQQMMLNLDPPDHSKLRKIVSRVFTPKMVNGMLESVERYAHEIVDGLEPDTEIDLVAKVSAEMPLMVLADLLGVPRSERHLLYSWTNRMVGLDDPAYGGRAAFLSAFQEMFAFAEEQTEIRRRDPGDDVWSLIVNAEVDGERLSTDELQRFFQLLMIAGNETTRNLLTGAVITLDQHPDQWAQLRANPDLLKVAIEEILRFHPPVMQFRRTAVTDAELGGQHIAAGDKVVMFYVSGNRDEAVFDEPDRFDIHRNPANHVAFGSGTHFCLGNSLARLEVRVLLSELFARFPQMRVAGPPARFRSNFINGYRELPVALGPAAA